MKELLLLFLLTVASIDSGASVFVGTVPLNGFASVEHETEDFDTWTAPAIIEYNFTLLSDSNVSGLITQVSEHSNSPEMDGATQVLVSAMLTDSLGNIINAIYDINHGSLMDTITFSTGFLQSGDYTIELAYEQWSESIQNVKVSAVPLPAAVWLFGSALVGMAGFKRRENGVRI